MHFPGYTFVPGIAIRVTDLSLSPIQHNGPVPSYDDWTDKDADALQGVVI